MILSGGGEGAKTYVLTNIIIQIMFYFFHKYQKETK